MLGYPNFEREFILETDASLRGLGAVLSQVNEEGKTHIIAYTSWTLTLSMPHASIVTISHLVEKVPLQELLSATELSMRLV